MQTIRVVGFGAMNLDELYRVQSVLADNETTVGEYQSSPGGSSANTIYGLAKLGISTGFIGVVGDDEAGGLLIKDFREVGVDTNQIKVKENTKTGKVLGLTDYYGKRALYVAPGANSLLNMDDVQLEYLKQTEFVHLSSFVDEEQFEIQKKVVDILPPSVKISFTPGAIYTRKGLNTLAPILEKTDILFANESEINELTGASYRIAARHLIDRGCRTVIVTLGKQTLKEIDESQLMMFEDSNHPRVLSPQAAPSFISNNDRFANYVADANDEYVIESAKVVRKKDTTGAGDAFATGFLYGLLIGKGIEECGRLGSIVAQLSIKQMGARRGLPNQNGLRRRYQELYNQPL
ncbi:MAG: carbohydrate kinase family protein [Dehalococcoidales bacterium]|nr:MAG: carbohydrate kinase family protein [Dehalococcoidales bacterium]